MEYEKLFDILSKNFLDGRSILRKINIQSPSRNNLADVIKSSANFNKLNEGKFYSEATRETIFNTKMSIEEKKNRLLFELEEVQDISSFGKNGIYDQWGLSHRVRN